MRFWVAKHRSNFSVVGLNGDLPQFTIQKERTDLTLDERGIMNSDTTGLVFSEFKDMLSSTSVGHLGLNPHSTPETQDRT